MKSNTRMLSIIRATFLPVTFALLLLTPVSATAEGCKFVGNATYSYIGNSVALTANQVQNLDASGVSGTLVMELWAFAAPYTGAAASGYKLAQFTVGTLVAGSSAFNINSGPIPFVSPPSGTWTFVLILTEAGEVVDWRNFAAAVIPRVGLWWNPDESGSGYALEYRHGILVIAIYSYQQTGGPQWYLVSGSITGTTFTATLDKYAGGQCISCPYVGRPSTVGNDGTIVVNFSSSTSATVNLPGGRVTQIQPFVF